MTDSEIEQGLAWLRLHTVRVQSIRLNDDGLWSLMVWPNSACEPPLIARGETLLGMVENAIDLVLQHSTFWAQALNQPH